MLRGLGSLLSRIFSSLFFYVPWCHFFLLLFPVIYFPRFFFWCLPSPNLFFFPPYALAALLPPFISFLLSLYSFFSLSFLYFSTFALTSLLPSAPFHLIPHFLAATSCSRNLIDSHTFPETNHGPHSPQYNNAPTCFRHSSWAA